jgi:DNA-binding XRE family transcriptional regulator
MATLTERQLESLRAAPLETLPNRLKVAFALANVQRSDAADATGLSAPTISKLINGQYQTLDIENARLLADFFGCAIEDLFPAKSEVA